ncbi:efflux transporter outer membrane subunit [Stutzerimonas tarimensis]|uniref:Efflux transporter outer membrane subunit n=1 Tax=Stutzerimonas tarimensis TaxID=1507735 RepID=A0ABV7T922_9GAMM
MRKLVSLFIMASLAGCQLAPPHERPASPTAERYPTEYDDQSGETTAMALGWRDFFLDPRLHGYLDSALERNRDLRIAVARIEEARGLSRVQGANRFPTLGLSADAARSRVPGVGATAAGEPGAVAAQGSGVNERYSVGLGVSAFELDFWSRVRNLSEAARAQYLATIEAQRAFRLSLIAEVTATYLAIREADERIALAQATVHSREEGLEIARVRFESGITSALDHAQAEALLTQAETQLANLRLNQALQRNYLVQLAGGDLSGPLPEPRPLTGQISPTRLAVGLPSALLYLRPDILAAEENLRAARANIGVARAAFFPQVSLTGSLGYASSELDNLISRDNRTWSIGPSLSLPLFDFGRNRGNLTVAEAREHVAVLQYEQAIETAFREVADALAGRRYLAEQITAQQRNMETLRRIAEIAQDRYAEGVAGYLEVLDAERNLFEAEQTLIQAQRAEVQNLVELYVALGGGLEAEQLSEAP